MLVAVGDREHVAVHRDQACLWVLEGLAEGRFGGHVVGVAQAPLRRAAQPSEVAEAAGWLLSERSSYVTGAVLRVDGGLGV